MPRSVRFASAALVLASMLSGCATGPEVAAVPPDAIEVANVRHTALPPPAPEWLTRETLPAGTQLSDGGKALLLEVTLRDGQLQNVELAPLELANLVVRVDQRDAINTVIAMNNSTASPLGLDLYASVDGAQFRRIPTCPLAPGGASFERWPGRLAWIAVANVRTAEISGKRCD